MIPNIKQRKSAAWAFDAAAYMKRGMIEWIFGAEEVEHHQLYCRFRKEANQKRFGMLKVMGWNIEVLNRLEWTAKLGVKVAYA